MNRNRLIKYSGQCAGFGCDREDACETCKECHDNKNEQYKACIEYENEVNAFERK
jgi:hypothetical protein